MVGELGNPTERAKLSRPIPPHPSTILTMLQTFPRDKTLQVVCRDMRKPEPDRTYYLVEFGTLTEEITAEGLRGRFASMGFDEEKVRLLMALIHNFCGVKVDPLTHEFKGDPVFLPEGCGVTDPNLANPHRRMGIRVDGIPVDKWF